ncbi:ATP phosphoribosyltransferase regulatory subunit [Virgibacillus kimchii]
MQPYVYDKENGSKIEDFQIREVLLSKLRNRFKTYGYKQIQTSAFEAYDVYANMTGTVKKDDMIKVVDSSGKVLVLRPDVTIPITRMEARNKQPTQDEKRYFYILDVFRQQTAQNKQKEHTQAGIEYLGKNTPEVDAEVIMLAVHLLKDLRFTNFKIEIGHAGFFKELIANTSLTEEQLSQLQSYIQSKNMSEMEPFLDTLPIESDLKQAIMQIPMLYGRPEEVLKRLKTISITDQLKQQLENLTSVWEVLEAYQISNDVVLNLGLINHMDYYTGVIFQGFVENAGKPVLMGGRYDQLGAQYNKNIPAIGFAAEVDVLLQAVLQQGLMEKKKEMHDFLIVYDKKKQKEALAAAYALRTTGYHALTFTSEEDFQSSGRYEIYFSVGGNELRTNEKKRPFYDTENLISIVEEMEEDN